MANHLVGSCRDFPFCSTRRERLGVSSGRRDTRLPPLSSKLYSCVVISSPALRVYSCSDSSTGKSTSSKPYTQLTCLNLSNSQFLRRISSGKKSLVPLGGCKSISCRGDEPFFSSPADLLCSFPLDADADAEAVPPASPDAAPRLSRGTRGTHDDDDDDDDALCGSGLSLPLVVQNARILLPLRPLSQARGSHFSSSLLAPPLKSDARGVS
mmetsp:Transcript_14887/g.30901  ORF Transcript_14887/g.30901 Transcript_14887/m.30901 type:complete len:211 (-) Transcript_14887:51-683(-)